MFHECPDFAKLNILKESLRLLRPGGSFILTDTPNDDLQTYRGFLEPYKEEWLHFDAPKFFTEAGFVNVEHKGVMGGGNGGTDNQLFQYFAYKPNKASL
jgi:hypothetical protein